MNQKLKRLFLQFAVYCCSDVLVFSALNFTLNLQSSINVEDGLGTKALAVTFSSAIAFGMLAAPLILRKLGPKIGLTISVSMVTAFIASNYYPKYATMIPAATLLGLSEATIWPSLVLMNVYFGTEYSKLQGRPKRAQDYVNIFSGCFFTMHHLNQVFGGIAGYFLLSENRNDDQLEQGNTTVTNATDSFAFCGANDCQEESRLHETITNYTPTNRYKFLIMISIFVAMTICSLILYVCILPNPRNKDSGNNNHQESDDKCIKEQAVVITVQSEKQGDGVSVSFIDGTTEQNVTKAKEVATIISSSMGAIAKQLVCPKQLLIIPITFYHGLLTSFLLSEIPRAYVSCLKGFAAISLYSCVFGFSHISSCIVGKLTKRIGRACILTVAMVLDTANLFFCLLWVPNIDTSWMIYISYFVFGITDGAWQLTLNLSHVVYFPKSREEAGSVWTTIVNLGLAAQFAWSTAFCTYEKIYIMLGTLIVGTILFHFAERMNRKEMK